MLWFIQLIIIIVAMTITVEIDLSVKKTGICRENCLPSPMLRPTGTPLTRPAPQPLNAIPADNFAPRNPSLERNLDDSNPRRRPNPKPQHPQRHRHQPAAPDADAEPQNPSQARASAA